MIENMKHQLDELTVTDMLSYLGARVSSMEERIRREDKQLNRAIGIIKNLCEMVRELNKPNVQLTNVDYSLSDAEQFLQEKLNEETR